MLLSSRGFHLHTLHIQCNSKCRKLILSPTNAERLEGVSTYQTHVSDTAVISFKGYFHISEAFL